MSLDELLKDSESTSAWKAQRRRFLRVIFGVSLSAVALAGGAGLLSTFKGAKVHRNQALATEQDQNAKSLAQLMRFQKETKSLQEELKELRHPASSEQGDNANVRRAAQSGRAASGGRIINFDPGEGFASVSVADKDVYIPMGAVFQAQMITPIKTSLERTFVMAETTREYRMDMKRRIPSRSRLVGRSRLNPVLKGVIVEFDTLVLPNGIETSVSGLALSRNALPEIEGLYFSNDIETYGTALAFGFLSGFAGAAYQMQATPFGSVPEVSLNNQVVAGLSTASFQVAEDILRDIRTRSVAYVVVPAGEQIFVALTRRYNMNQGASK